MFETCGEFGLSMTCCDTVKFLMRYIIATIKTNETALIIAAAIARIFPSLFGGECEGEFGQGTRCPPHSPLLPEKELNVEF
jgi:hypothetical protein